MAPLAEMPADWLLYWFVIFLCTLVFDSQQICLIIIMFILPKSKVVEVVEYSDEIVAVRRESLSAAFVKISFDNLLIEGN